MPVERIPEKYAPNIFDTGSGNTGDTPWYIQAQINYFWKDSNPDIFHDRTHHDIYIGMTMQEYQANDESRYNAFPAIQGDVENHNCLWDLNRFYTGGNKVEQFREENLVRILGTWGHVVDDAVAGIIEFRPTPQIQGRIIANGWAHCYSLPREWSLDQNRQLCQKLQTRSLHSWHRAARSTFQAMPHFFWLKPDESTAHSPRISSTTATEAPALTYGTYSRE